MSSSSCPARIAGAYLKGNKHFELQSGAVIAAPNPAATTAAPPATTAAGPTSKDQCQKSGRLAFTLPGAFKNQGDCVSFVQPGK